jgi:hypothetical protein
MPVDPTTLSRGRLSTEDAAVLLIDHQAGLLSLVQDYSPDEFRNKSVRDAALMRMTQAGAVMVNWFAVACELARDWRNDMEGLAGLLCGHLPAYRNLITSYNALTDKK